tara:strand:- start:9610 stop:9804 length:195 start_codon:yes stop_codon:yes gene_type:complete
MSVARLSITVPEALWREACPIDASPSKVIQEALRLMVDTKQDTVREAVRAFYIEALAAHGKKMA